MRLRLFPLGKSNPGRGAGIVTEPRKSISRAEFVRDLVCASIRGLLFEIATARFPVDARFRSGEANGP